MAKMEGLAIQNLLLSSATALTLSDRRLYNYLLHNAFSKLSRQLDFVISLDELRGVYGTGLAPLDRIKESLRRLLRTLIEFEIAPKKWVVTGLLESAEVNEFEQQLHYTYPLPCRVLFTHPVTLEKCLIQAHFSLKYSNMLYEILATEHYIKQPELSLEITDLRSRLQISDNKLTNFSDLERFVLTPALKEINSYASFAVKFHTQRKGMKVTHVIFQMKGKNNIATLTSAQQVIPPKRPRFFIDNPDSERAYSYLLNAETKERQRYFDLAVKLANKKKHNIEEEEFDRPDLWFKWVEGELLKEI